MDDPAIDIIAAEMGIPRVRVDGAVTFYAFFTKEPIGQITIRLSSDIIDQMHGAEEVAEALADELGIDFGQTTADGVFSLHWTPCIGMSDQAPAALVGDTMVTHLTAESARQMVRMPPRAQASPKTGPEAGRWQKRRPTGPRHGQEPYPPAGGHCLQADQPGRSDPQGARHDAGGSDPRVEDRTAPRPGRGRFSRGMKWDFTRAAAGDRKYVICNADEGEPGTFKDRVLLTELPDRIFAGHDHCRLRDWCRRMASLYLRGEYAYLKPFLEDVLAKRRAEGWLGQNIAGKAGFHFDIRIQLVPEPTSAARRHR